MCAYYKSTYVRRKNMIAKIWKKVLFAILIIACLFNITFKLVHKTSLKKELETSGQYLLEEEQAENEVN